MFGCVWHDASYKASHDLLAIAWDLGRLRCLPGYQGLLKWNTGLEDLMPTDQPDSIISDVDSRSVV
jgi:hypothetical protein